MKILIIALLTIIVIVQYLKIRSNNRTILHKNGVIHVLRHRLGDKQDYNSKPPNKKANCNHIYQCTECGNIKPNPVG